MRKAETIRTQAIMLRRTNYGEADRVLSLITLDNGKISAIAKGVRKAKSKLAGGLELFALSDVTITYSKGDMGLITSARLEKFYGHVLHDYDRMQLGYECIKQIAKATETVAEEEFFYLLRDTLTYLDELSIDYRVIELWFRLQMAQLLGVGLNLAQDAEGEPLRSEASYTFDFDSMAFVAVPKGNFGVDHIKFLRLTHAKNPAILRQVSGVGTIIDDCLWLARAL